MGPEDLTLIGALVLAVSFLGRFALQAHADVKEDRDAWRLQAEQATTGLNELTLAILEVAPDLKEKLARQPRVRSPR